MNNRNAWVLALLLAAGCSGDGEGDGSEGLNGTWYFLTQVNGAPAYVGEHIILEQGSHVTIRDCRGYVTELTREGNSLHYANGNLYYLRVQDSSTLTGPGDLGGTSTAVKLLPRTRFADGTVRLSLLASGNLDAVDDVCASYAPGRFGSGAVDRELPRVIISAPHGQGFLRVSLAFRALTAGVHPLFDLDAFVQGSGPGAYVEVESPEFQSRYGGDVLPIVSGSIEVTDSHLATFTIQGTLQLTTGESAKVSARVDLTNPVPSDR